MYTHRYTRTHTHITHARTHTHSTYVHTYIQTYKQTYIHTHTHTHTHTYTYSVCARVRAHTHKQRFSLWTLIQTRRCDGNACIHTHTHDSTHTMVFGTGGKKLKGFMSSGKKESLFRTSETGRVGFTGSGRGMVGTLSLWISPLLKPPSVALRLPPLLPSFRSGALSSHHLGDEVPRTNLLSLLTYPLRPSCAGCLYLSHCHIALTDAKQRLDPHAVRKSAMGAGKGQDDDE